MGICVGKSVWCLAGLSVDDGIRRGCVGATDERHFGHQSMMVVLAWVGLRFARLLIVVPHFAATSMECYVTEP